MDEEYFISPVPKNQHLEAGLSVGSDQGRGSNRFQSAVMDLVADDIAGMRKQRSLHYWDKVITEGGKRLKAKKTGIYDKWKANTPKKISPRGTDNQGGGRFNRRFQPQRQIPNARLPSEIKDLEQVRKQRQRKATQQSYMKNKSNKRKGNSFGKNGNNRKAK